MGAPTHSHFTTAQIVINCTLKYALHLSCNGVSKRLIIYFGQSLASFRLISAVFGCFLGHGISARIRGVVIKKEVSRRHKK